MTENNDDDTTTIIIDMQVFNESSNATLFRLDINEILYGSDLGKDTEIIEDLYIWIFLSTFVAVGVICNVLTIFALLRAKCNGTRYYLLQMAFCDIGNLSVSGLELFYMNHRKWILPLELCPVYLGIESFTSTASIYFIIALNLHAISIYNLTLETLERRELIESEYTQLAAEPMPEDVDDNYEVALNTQKRSLTIDYGKRKSGISVILPALFIWFLAASMAIPLFVFGDVMPNEINPLICGVMNFDKHNNYLIQVFVLVLRMAVPIVALHWSCVCVVAKLCLTRKRRIRPCGLDENAIGVLKLALLLAGSFAILAVQRIYGSLFFEVISKPFMHYKYPHMDGRIGIALSMASFALPAIRPLMYVTIDRQICDTFLLCGSEKRKRKMSRGENEVTAA